jgi:hypothetical protein
MTGTNEAGILRTDGLRGHAPLLQSGDRTLFSWLDAVLMAI